MGNSSDENVGKDEMDWLQPDSPYRPATRSLMMSIMMDTWPGVPTCVDFGIDSQAHYEAIYYPVRDGEITARQLEEAMGNGPKLTALVRAAKSNPHESIEFSTSWDRISLSDLKTAQWEQPQTKSKDIDHER